MVQSGKLLNAIPSCLPETHGWKAGQCLPTSELELYKWKSWHQKAPGNAEMSLFEETWPLTHHTDSW